jgi:hypothetical protein
LAKYVAHRLEMRRGQPWAFQSTVAVRIKLLIAPFQARKPNYAPNAGAPPPRNGEAA